MDLGLKNQQWFKCHKTKPSQTKYFRQQAIVIPLGKTKGKSKERKGIFPNSHAEQRYKDQLY